MGIVSTHVFVSGKANTADLTEVQGARDWDDGHKFINGNSGSVLVRDTSDATYGSNWVQSVATGSVLVSAGVGSLPAWSVSPTLTALSIGSAPSSISPGINLTNNVGIFSGTGVGGTATLITGLANAVIIGDSNTSSVSFFGPLFPAVSNTVDLGAPSRLVRSGYFAVSIANLGYYEGTEISTPSAGAVNTGRLYFDDNGGGKTRLMCLFNTGAAQQLAIQP